MRPDGTATAVTYDEDGNVKTRLDANGITTTYTHDTADRLTDTQYSAGPTPNVHFDYYPDNAARDMVDGSDTTTWTYDSAGNVLSAGGGRGTVSYTYWPNNLRQSMTEGSPAEPSALTWNYTYDDANRPDTLVDPYNGTIDFDFDQADRLTAKIFPNNLKTAYGYDSANELTDVRTATSANATLEESAYTYDPAGNVATRTDHDGTLASFLYDGADQLSVEDYQQGGNDYYIGYTYDHNGNRATQNNNGALTSYAYDAGDRTTSDSNGGAYTYDANGNWTKLVIGASTYASSTTPRTDLTHYQSPTIASAYAANGFGLRVAEYDSGSGQHDLINDGTAPGSPLLVHHDLSPPRPSPVSSRPAWSSATALAGLCTCSAWTGWARCGALSTTTGGRRRPTHWGTMPSGQSGQGRAARPRRSGSWGRKATRPTPTS